MLSYQHAYHAGCLADVHKHAVLVHLLEYLRETYPRLTYIDTHSGRGIYRLDSAEAQKTGEAKQGISRLMKEQRLAEQPLATVLRQIRGKRGPQAYPGSPFIAQQLLRDGDRLQLFELHPSEGAALRRNMQGRNLRVYQEDGYEGAMRLCPPVPLNGLLLVDPSFEVKSEYLEAAQFLRDMAGRWPKGVLLLWYPLLKADNHIPMVSALEAAGLPGYWRQEIRFCEPGEVRGLYGSGVVVVNLPEALHEPLNALANIFTGLY